MKFIKVTAAFETDNLVLAEELICDIFFSFNLKGVVCNLPLDEPDEGFGTNTLPPPPENSIVGYLPDVDASALVVEKIRARVMDLTRFGITPQIREKVVDEADWAHAWKDYFNVTRITDRVVIKPEWKPYTPEPDDVVIHLDPGMAFGTGTHPTTAMCLARIEKHLKPDHRFLDVGCGSGILMVGAAKLGAGPMVGIDTDETAVGITRENLDKNSVPPEHYHLFHGTLAGSDVAASGSFDLIGANIIAQVLADIMGDLATCMGPDSLTVLSGIIRDRKGDVTDAVTAHGLQVLHEDNVDEWVTLTIRRV